MNYKNITYKVENKIGVLTINRPDKLNALNRETLKELNDLLGIIKSDGSKVLIITGTGDKAFVAGADIEEINNLDGVSGKEFAEFGQKIFNKIEQLGKPVIAAVNGYALGGGCELAMSCHMRIASEDAKFGQPEIKLGIIPGYGGTQRLTKYIGLAKSIEYSLTGDMIDAQSAERLGLVNKVVSKENLMEVTNKLAEKISSYSSVVVGNLLNAIIKGKELNISEGLHEEAKHFAACCNTEDFKEGTGAFLEKRRPVFKDK